MKSLKFLKLTFPGSGSGRNRNRWRIIQNPHDQEDHQQHLQQGPQDYHESGRGYF